jgi:hypothetical protein
MNGTMGRLLGAVVVSTLILGGCVVETGEEEQGQDPGQLTTPGVSAAPRSKDPGSSQTNPPSGGVMPATPQDPSCASTGEDPEPTPWVPPPSSSH